MLTTCPISMQRFVTDTHLDGGKGFDHATCFGALCAIPVLHVCSLETVDYAPARAFNPSRKQSSQLQIHHCPQRAQETNGR